MIEAVPPTEPSEATERSVASSFMDMAKTPSQSYCGRLTQVDWRVIATSRGEKAVRFLLLGRPGEDFWSLWKSELKASGKYSLRKDERSGSWELSEWADPSVAKKDAPAVQANAAASTKPPFVLDESIRKGLSEVAPRLLDYQRPAVESLTGVLSKHGKALDSSDTGTGKTYVSVAVAKAMGKKAFVVCPKAVIPAWKAAAEHMGVDLEVINYEKLKAGNTPFAKWETADDREQFKWSEEALPKASTLIIFDETHRLKNYKSQNNEMGVAALLGGYKTLGLSATAAANPLEMKFTGLLTGEFASPRDFWGWALKNGVSKNRFGYEFNGDTSVLSRMHGRIFPEHGNRIKISDLGDKFPETKIICEPVEMADAAKIRKLYSELEKSLHEIGEKKQEASNILVHHQKCHQEAELLRVPAMVEMAQDAASEGMGVALFANYNETVDALSAKLKTTCIIKGGQKDDVREANRVAFQKDKSEFIVCNIRAGGVGISLHGEGPQSKPRLALIAPTWSAQDLKQALGRVHRAGGAKSIQRIAYCADTIEEKICKSVRAKLSNIDALNDGDLASDIFSANAESPNKAESASATKLEEICRKATDMAASQRDSARQGRAVA